MKKLLSIAILFFAVTFVSFSATTIPLPPAMAGYNATVLCVPHMTGPAPINLGTFMPGQTIPMTDHQLIWKVWGDYQATYNITVTNSANWLAAGVNYTSTPGTSVLTGNWSYLGGDGETDDAVTPTTWKASDPFDGDITCNDTYLSIIFTTTQLMTDNPVNTQAETFMITVTVSATF